jgi:hypothetical protein
MRTTKLLIILISLIVFSTNVGVLSALCPATQISAPTVISNPDTYCLVANINGPIEIATSNVFLDLNGHSIIGANSGIIIDANVQNVTVQNGAISTTAGDAIIANSGCQALRLRDLKIFNSGGTEAILLTGCDGCLVEDILIEQGTTLQAGISVEDTNDSIIKNCEIINLQTTTSLVGIHIFISVASAVSNQISHCTMSNCSTSGGTISGIQVDAGVEDTFVEHCVISNISSDIDQASGIVCNANDASFNHCYIQAVTSPTAAFGCFLQGTDLLINDCQVQNILMNNDNGSNASGFSIPSGSQILVKNSIVMYISAPDTTSSQGFYLGSSAYNLEIDSCSVTTVTAVTGDGFDIFSAYSYIHDCRAYNCGNNGILVSVADPGTAILEKCVTTSCNIGLYNASGGEGMFSNRTFNNGTNFVYVDPNIITYGGSTAMSGGNFDNSIIY